MLSSTGVLAEFTELGADEVVDDFASSLTLYGVVVPVGSSLPMRDAMANLA